MLHKSDLGTICLGAISVCNMSVCGGRCLFYCCLIGCYFKYGLELLPCPSSDVLYEVWYEYSRLIHDDTCECVQETCHGNQYEIVLKKNMNNKSSSCQQLFGIPPSPRQPPRINCHHAMIKVGKMFWCFLPFRSSEKD